MHVKDLFVPKLVDNSPRGWVRYGGMLTVQSTATTVGLYGGILIVAGIYQLWRMKIDALVEENLELRDRLKNYES